MTGALPAAASAYLFAVLRILCAHLVSNIINRKRLMRVRVCVFYPASLLFRVATL